MTLRPFGPSVTLTVLARSAMPRSMLSRASPLNLSSLAVMFGTPGVKRLYASRRRHRGHPKCRSPS